MSLEDPIAIYHEHPGWFIPLFAELDRRGVPYLRLDAASHRYDPEQRRFPYSLFVNRMSPSAWQRGHAQGIFYTLDLLAHLERIGLPTVNGYEAFRMETSKARQCQLLDGLGIPCPRARVINHLSQAVEAAQGFRYPLVLKANIGGSGAGIVRLDSEDELRATVEAGDYDLGLDHTALVQEFIPPAEGLIVRVEVLDGRFLYAIKVYTTGETFNLCPADICQTTDGGTLERATCPVEAAGAGLKVEGYTPPAEIIATVERISRAAKMDVCGIEYLTDERDGRTYFYDINALSNFVADAPRVIGFDPFERFVDYLIHRAGG